MTRAPDIRKVIVESRLFDPRFYLSQSPGIAGAGFEPLGHFLEQGAAEGRNPHPLFDTGFYLKNNPDVAEDGINPLLHFIEYGAAPGYLRNPHPLFDMEFYVRQDTGVERQGLNPLVHYLEIGGHGVPLLNPHPLFDTAFYLRQNPEVRERLVNPLIHFIEIGAGQGCDPHPLFDIDYYRRQNPDLAKEGANPLLHFIEYGAAPGGGHDPHHLFACDFYLRENPDVAELGVNPLIHYVEHGARECRDPHPCIDSRLYRKQNPGAVKRSADALVFYLARGFQELREQETFFDSEFYLEQKIEHGAKATGRRVVAAARRPTISVCTLTQNHASTIRACLDSVAAVADEILVVDAGSTDGTLDYVRSYANARVIKSEFGGIAAQRNIYLSEARGDWVLSIDADEVMGSELQREITLATRSEHHVACWFPRYWVVALRPLLFLENEVNYPDHQLRLFRNSPDLAFYNEVHQHIDVAGLHRHLVRPHLFHLHYLLLSRSERLARLESYERLQPGAGSGIYRKYYLFEEYPFVIRRCNEALGAEVHHLETLKRSALDRGLFRDLAS